MSRDLPSLPDDTLDLRRSLALSIPPFPGSLASLFPGVPSSWALVGLITAPRPRSLLCRIASLFPRSCLSSRVACSPLGCKDCQLVVSARQLASRPRSQHDTARFSGWRRAASLVRLIVQLEAENRCRREGSLYWRDYLLVVMLVTSLPRALSRLAGSASPSRPRPCSPRSFPASTLRDTLTMAQQRSVHDHVRPAVPSLARAAREKRRWIVLPPHPRNMAPLSRAGAPRTPS